MPTLTETLDAMLLVYIKAGTRKCEFCEWWDSLCEKSKDGQRASAAEDGIELVGGRLPCETCDGSGMVVPELHDVAGVVNSEIVAMVLFARGDSDFDKMNAALDWAAVFREHAMKSAVSKYGAEEIANVITTVVDEWRDHVSPAKEPPSGDSALTEAELAELLDP